MKNDHDNQLRLRLINRIPNLTVNRLNNGLKFDYHEGLNFMVLGKSPKLGQQSKFGWANFF